MNEDFVRTLYSQITDKLVDSLYLSSIEKLKKHLEVEEVSNRFGLHQSFETLLKLTKGKDLLTRFLFEIQKILSEQHLYKLCYQESVEACSKYSEKEHSKFCLYITARYDIPQLRKYAFEQVDIETLTPIKERLQQLK